MSIIGDSEAGVPMSPTTVTRRLYFTTSIRRLFFKIAPFCFRAQRVAKNYTAKTEAYELYLKGRYHHLKLTLPEIRKGISFYQQAIDADPTYALAYAGLAAAYRALAIAGWGSPVKGSLSPGKGGCQARAGN